MINFYPRFPWKTVLQALKINSILLFATKYQRNILQMTMKDQGCNFQDFLSYQLKNENPPKIHSLEKFIAENMVNETKNEKQT